MFKITISHSVINRVIESIKKVDDLIDEVSDIPDIENFVLVNKAIQARTVDKTFVIDINPQFIDDVMDSVDKALPYLLNAVQAWNTYFKYNEKLTAKLVKKYFE